ncbi:MAG: hypothetical protein ACK5MR_16240 [Cumulibacter sp.]
MDPSQRRLLVARPRVDQRNTGMDEVLRVAGRANRIPGSADGRDLGITGRDRQTRSFSHGEDVCVAGNYRVEGDDRARVAIRADRSLDPVGRRGGRDSA